MEEVKRILTNIHQDIDNHLRPFLYRINESNEIAETMKTEIFNLSFIRDIIVENERLKEELTSGNTTKIKKEINQSNKHVSLDITYLEGENPGKLDDELSLITEENELVNVSELNLEEDAEEDLSLIHI